MATRRAQSHQPVAIVALAFSGACHAICVGLVFLPTTRAAVRFADELALLVVASLACSVAAFAIGSFHAFLLPHLVRIGIILAAFRIARAAPESVRYLLLLPLVAESCLAAGPVYGALFSVLLLAGAAGLDLFDLEGIRPIAAAANSAATFLIGSGFTGACALLVYYRERLAQQHQRMGELSDAVASLSEANRAMQSYAGNVEEQSAAKERSRVTRELHDSVGYAFTSIMMTMSAAKALMRTDLEEAESALESIRAQAEAAMADTRRILHRLRAIRDVELGGLRAIAHLVRSFRAATGANVVVSYGNLPVTYGMEIDEAIYRLVQEGLTNAFRHGHARSVRVTMWETDAEIRETVWDDGRSLAKATEGIGLRGMRERFDSLGGAIDAKATDHGFQLNASIPYRRPRRNG